MVPAGQPWARTSTPKHCPVFGMFMDMDNMLGTDIEKGLAQLKTVAEGKEVAAAAACDSG
jgi:hypothetical protein